MTARLDAQAGVRFEGQQPEFTEEDGIAIAVSNALQNGMGGFDWNGLPILVEYYGIDDVEGLIDRLLVIKNHRPPKDD